MRKNGRMKTAISHAGKEGCDTEDVDNDICNHRGEEDRVYTAVYALILGAQGPKSQYKQNGGKPIG
jgi:hypothetical protein